MNTQMTTAADIAYKAVGDYLLPVIALPESTGTIGHFGRLRKAFLRENRPLIFQTMLLNGTLDAHLADLKRESHSTLVFILCDASRRRHAYFLKSEGKLKNALIEYITVAYYDVEQILESNEISPFSERIKNGFTPPKTTCQVLFTK